MAEVGLLPVAALPWGSAMKGQVTIPVALRDQMGVDEGTDVVLEIDGNTLVLPKDAFVLSQGRVLAERLRSQGDAVMRTDEVMAGTRPGGACRSDHRWTATSCSTTSPTGPTGSAGRWTPW